MQTQSPVSPDDPSDRASGRRGRECQGGPARLMCPPRPRHILTLLLLAAAASPGAFAAAQEVPGEVEGRAAAVENSPGLDVDLARAPLRLPAAAPGSAAEGTPPLVVRISVRWVDLEPEAGRYAWDGLDEAIRAATEGGARIIVNLHGGHPVHTGGRPLAPSDVPGMEAWTALLREIVQRHRESVWAWQVGRHPEPDPATAAEAVEAAARDFAFTFKRSAVAIRSADPEALVAVGPIDPSALQFASILYEEEISPYADALAASFNGTETDRAGLEALSALLLVHDPSAHLWINEVPVLVGMEGYGQILRGFTSGMEREAALVTFQDPPDSEGRPFHAALFDNLRGLFTAGFAPLVESGRGVKALSASGEALPAGRVSRFFDAESKSVLMLYDAGPGVARGEFGVFVLDTVDVAEPVLHDLAAGESAPNVAMQREEGSGLTRLALPLAEYPLVLAYRRFTTPEYATEGEKLDVTRERLPSAEEIIARHQAVQEAQDALLNSVRAEATEEWHFTAGATGSVDIRFESGFFYDPNVGAEWEQKAIFINGVRWRGNKIPEFPFLTPERAVSLPLVVSLSKEYRYEYEGREEVNGFDCHVISFKPIDETKNLSKGRVWIDAATYAKVRLAQAQDNQPAPIVSNDQRDTYAPVTGPDGFRYWIISRIDSEQIYSTVGFNVVVTKSARLRDFMINAPDFAERRAAALASDHTIMRETEKGTRYLQRNSDGTRTVKDEPSTMSLSGVGGVLANRSLPFPVPLVGVNWFEGDLAHRGAQANVFFAGAFLFATIADPRFLDSRLQANADLVGFAIAGADRLVRENPVTGRLNEKEAEEITQKTQTLTLGMGLPFWKFFKLKGEGRLAYSDYGRTGDSCDFLALPRDTWVRSGTLKGEFNRRAWGVELEHEWSWRARNEPWGLEAADPAGQCPSAGGGLPPDFFESAKNYVRYGGTIAKNFYLPHNQKLTFRLSGKGSRDLDRFSKYDVSLFGDRIRGLSGGGIHYTNGGILRADYAFSLGEVIRFGGGVDFARLKDRQQLGPFRNFTGAGISATFVAPWNLLVRLEYGITLDSEIPQFEGEQEILLTVFKLFSQR